MSSKHFTIEFYLWYECLKCVNTEKSIHNIVFNDHVCFLLVTGLVMSHDAKELAVYAKSLLLYDPS